MLSVFVLVSYPGDRTLESKARSPRFAGLWTWVLTLDVGLGTLDLGFRNMAVIIIGAGIIGLTLARELSRNRVAVWLVDPQKPASEASWAAAGILSVSSEAEHPGEFFQLCRQAAAMYPDYVRQLEEETGLPAGYRSEGTLFLYRSSQEQKALEQRFSWQRDLGVPAVHMSSAEVRVMEPEARAEGGYFLPGDCQVNNRLLCAALVESCRRAQVATMQIAVRAVAVEGNRAVGVELVDGTRLRGDAVVNAAGAWTSRIVAPGPPLIVQPVKGHMLTLNTEGWSLTHVVQDGTIYLVPRTGGRVIAGSTMENAGFDKAIDPATVGHLREAAHRLAPRLAEATLSDAWTGLRPLIVRGGPRVGPGAVPGYFIATGHLRSGILLAPLTARLLTPVIQGAEPDPLLVPFLP